MPVLIATEETLDVRGVEPNKEIASRIQEVFEQAGDHYNSNTNGELLKEVDTSQKQDGCACGEGYPYVFRTMLPSFLENSQDRRTMLFSNNVLFDDKAKSDFWTHALPAVVNNTVACIVVLDVQGATSDLYTKCKVTAVSMTNPPKFTPMHLTKERTRVPYSSESPLKPGYMVYIIESIPFTGIPFTDTENVVSEEEGKPEGDERSKEVTANKRSQRLQEKSSAKAEPVDHHNGECTEAELGQRVQGQAVPPSEPDVQLVVFALAMNWGCTADVLRLNNLMRKMEEKSGKGTCKVITVSDSETGKAIDAKITEHLHLFFDSHRGVNELQENVFLKRSEYPNATIEVYLDFFWLEHNYFIERYGMKWPTTALGLIDAGANLVVLPVDIGGNMADMLSKSPTVPDHVALDFTYESRLFEASKDDDVQTKLIRLGRGNLDTQVARLDPSRYFVQYACELPDVLAAEEEEEEDEEGEEQAAAAAATAEEKKKQKEAARLHLDEDNIRAYKSAHGVSITSPNVTKKANDKENEVQTEFAKALGREVIILDGGGVTSKGLFPLLLTQIKHVWNHRRDVVDSINEDLTLTPTLTLSLTLSLTLTLTLSLTLSLPLTHAGVG